MWALKSLGNKYEHFGSFLLPLTFERLPNTIKLQISWKLGKSNWKLEQFLLATDQDITARENFEYLKPNSFDCEDESKNFTTSSLNDQARLENACFVSMKITIAINIKLWHT